MYRFGGEELLTGGLVGLFSKETEEVGGGFWDGGMPRLPIDPCSGADVDYGGCAGDGESQPFSDCSDLATSHSGHSIA